MSIKKIKYATYPFFASSGYFIFAAFAFAYFFVFPFVSLAETYDRDPAGSLILTEGSSEFFGIYVEFDDLSDPLWSDWQTASPTINSWNIWVQDAIGSEDKYFSDCYDYPSDLVGYQIFDLELGEYSVVSARGYNSSDCSGEMIAAAFPEYDDGNPIFLLTNPTSTPFVLTEDPRWGQHIFQASVLFFLVYFGFLFYFKKP